MKEINGLLEAKSGKWAIVVGRTNSFISDKLLEGAVDCLIRHGAQEENIDVVRVPGAFEMPLAAGALAAGKKYSSIICLGAVIRGSTPHFDFVASEAAKGIAQVSVNSSIPVAFGVLTTDTIEQAVERAGTKSGNKGWDAALCAIEMADVMKKL